MTPTTRRAHKKSRHGCQQCKKNRTKCDEKRPSCSRCVRLGATCSLLDPTSALIIINDSNSKPRRLSTNPESHSTSASNAASTSQSPAWVNLSPETAGLASPPVPVPAPASTSNEPDKGSGRISTEFLPVRDHSQISDPELERLRLIHYYNQSTSHSIIELTMGTEEGRSIWHDKVPELAFRNDYLLHGLLAVTALHLALKNPSADHHYGVLAMEYHSHGFALYTSRLSVITADNIDALFAFASLSAVFSFGIHLRGRHRLSPLVKIHEIFTVLRGNSLLVDNGMQWLENGIWSPWFRDKDDQFIQKLPDEMEQVISLLISRINSTITTSSNGQMYLDVIEALRQNFVLALLRPRTHMALVMLPVSAPAEYITMICIGEPLALSILANWAVVLHWLRGHIWLRNWGLETVKAVHEVLPPEWQECIAWAMSQIETSQEPPLLPALGDDETIVMTDA